MFGKRKKKEEFKLTEPEEVPDFPEEIEEPLEEEIEEEEVEPVRPRKKAKKQKTVQVPVFPSRQEMQKMIWETHEMVRVMYLDFKEG